jgi:hypothetical protein
MPSRDVQVLRNFTMKLAAQTKRANPLAALSDPKVLGMLGGGALTGLGAYGLAQSVQSDEDRERGGMMPMLAGLAGAGAGAYGGSYLPQLLAALRGRGGPLPQNAANPYAKLTESAGAGIEPTVYSEFNRRSQGVPDGSAGASAGPVAAARAAVAPVVSADKGMLPQKQKLDPLSERANQNAAAGVTNDPQISLGR